jgi:hypothetical protein
VGVKAGAAYRSNKLAGKPAGCADMDAAFTDRMVTPVNASTDLHAGKTADTFIHLIGSDNFGHRVSSSPVLIML